MPAPLGSWQDRLSVCVLPGTASLAGAPVFVKVVSKTGQRVSLSMRDVDQATGEDLLPMGKGGPGQDLRSNPAGPAGPASGANAVGNMTALHGLSGIKVGPGSPPILGIQCAPVQCKWHM